jgi:phosphate transport system substrate-binding protein
LSRIAQWKVLLAVLVLSLGLVGCGAQVGEGDAPQESGEANGSGEGEVEAATSLTGAGASFPAPIYSAMFQQLAEQEGIQVNYQSIGSSGGREQFTQQTVDFGASDAPMDEEEEEQAGGNPLHIATVGGAVVPAFNLEGVDTLNFTGEVLADIYLGEITTWSDPAIAELNPDADLPDADIAVVHRSDGSGTTEIFTSYLAAVDPDWENGPGAGSEINWPTGIGAEGNEGVSGQVQQTPNSIGYVNLEYAIENDIPFGNVGASSEGPFVEPSTDTASNAIDAADIPDDLKVVVSSLAPEGDDVYPITGLTWLLVRQQMDDLSKCKAVAEMAWFMTHEGQELAPEQNYVPIPDSINSINEEFIRSMEAEGQPCYEE